MNKTATLLTVLSLLSSGAHAQVGTPKVESHYKLKASSGGADASTRYQWRGPDAGTPVSAEGIVIQEIIENGKRFLSVTGAPGGKGSIPFVGGRQPIDNPGSKDIRIQIDPQTKSTTYAGLTFGSACVVEILADGTVVTDKEGIQVSDVQNKRWVATRCSLNGGDAVCFLPASGGSAGGSPEPPAPVPSEPSTPLPRFIDLESTDGKTIQAAIITMAADSVLIRRVSDGATFDIPLSRLTAATIQRIKDHRAAKAADQALKMEQNARNLQAQRAQVSAAAPVASTPQAPTTPDALEGRWVLVESESEGEPSGERVIRALAQSLTVRGGRFTDTIFEGSSKARGGYVDETRNGGTLGLNAIGNLNGIDFTFDSGPLAGKHRKGIYRLNGTHLVICVRTDDGQRPQGFQTRKGDKGLTLNYYQKDGGDGSQGSDGGGLAGNPQGWPSMTGELSGGMEVRVRNPNEFSVKVALRSGGMGTDFSVGANGVKSASVPNGRYDIYFQYSTDPDGIYQGDSFTLNNNGVEIQIVKVVNGNYGIRKVR